MFAFLTVAMAYAAVKNFKSCGFAFPLVRVKHYAQTWAYTTEPHVFAREHNGSVCIDPLNPLIEK